MQMEFYNTDNKKIIINDEIFGNAIKSGKCGTVYHYNEDLCFKLYNQKYTEYQYRLSIYLYDILKNIDNPNLVDIKELYFKEDNKARCNSDAYMSKYYKKKYSDILEVPVDYLLNNVERLLMLGETISSKKIIFNDLKVKNCIMTDNDFVLLDPDLWEHSHNSKKEIIEYNINYLSYFFKEYVKYSLENNHHAFMVENGLYSREIERKLFPITDNPKKTIKVLTKKLSGYKRPIDYIYSMKK